MGKEIGGRRSFRPTFRKFFLTEQGQRGSETLPETREAELTDESLTPVSPPPGPVWPIMMMIWVFGRPDCMAD